MDLYDAIARRRDTRSEFTGRPVPPEVLRRVLGAAHRAPSVGMSQPTADLPEVPDLERLGWRGRAPLDSVIHDERHRG